MADAKFFKGNWKIVGSAASRAYPEGRWVSIGSDPQFTDRFVISWLDADGILHIFRQLTLDAGGKLQGDPAVEVGTGHRWKFTIEQDGTSQDLKGTVANPLRAIDGDFVEASLAGSWGAEAPPPPFDDRESPGSGDI